jgi:hypothetical protein
LSEKVEQVNALKDEAKELRSGKFTDKALWRTKYQSLERQYNELLAEAKAVEYKSSDPASFLQIQAHVIEDLLISGKRGQRKSNLKEQDTATK